MDEVTRMREEVLATQLDMTCTIERRTETGEDPAGQPTYDWAATTTDEPCHYWKEMETEIVGPQNAVVSRERMVLQASADVQDADRITVLTDIDGGNVVADTPLDIVEVIRQQNQVQLVLKQIA